MTLTDFAVCAVVMLNLGYLWVIEEKIMAKFDELTAQIHRNTDVVESALVLIHAMADAIQEAGTDQAALDSLVAEIKSEADKLSEAVAANTKETP
jgi:hypothetical protein